jgi:hypothetical protein
MYSVEEAEVYTTPIKDPASQALALELPPNVRKSISAQARHGNVPRTHLRYGLAFFISILRPITLWRWLFHPPACMMD